MKNFAAIIDKLENGKRHFIVGEKHSVEVSHCKERQRDGLTKIKLQAQAATDNHVEEHTWTIGPADGERPIPDTQEALQSKLDALREKVAISAAWKAETNQNAEKLE